MWNPSENHVPCPEPLAFWRFGRVFAVGVFLVLTVALCGAGMKGAHAQRQSRDSVTRQPAGELVRLVRQDCGSCHGLTLKGGLGKPLLPENLAGRDAETIAAIILDGIPGTPMPPWRGILTEADALWIARKLKEGFPHAAP